MLLAIISDIHDNLANLEKCLNWCQKNKVTKIICPGDITALETINFLASKFPGEIFIVKGNGEIYMENELISHKNINYCGEIGITEIDKIRIGFCHERRQIIKIMDVTPWPLDFIFYGHSHKPWLEKQKNVFIVNPGNLCGVFHQATFATLDTETKKVELKILADPKL